MSTNNTRLKDFEIFWNLYGFKKDRIAAERAWKRLSAKEKRAAIDGINAYRSECVKRGIAMMYAQGYLNHRRWEDERDDNAVERATAPVQAVASGNNDSPAAEKKSAGYRLPNEDELHKLFLFKEALLQKKPAKPECWDRFRQRIVDNLDIPFVRTEDDLAYLRLHNGDETISISDSALDAYDAADDFKKIMNEVFGGPCRITLSIRK